MTNKKNTPAIVAMLLLMAMIAFVTNLASPMGDILKNQFTVANWVGTLGVFATFIAYAVMGVPAGMMLERWGYKRTALAAIGVGFAGVGIQTLSGFIHSDTALIVYLVGAFIGGFAVCMLNTVVNPMLNKLGGAGNRGNQFIQLGGVFNSVAGTSVVILVGVLLPRITDARIGDVLPLMVSALAIFALAFVAIAFTRIPEREKTTKTATTGSPLSYPHFVLGAIAIFVYVGVEVGIPNVLNKWLQNDAGLVGLFGSNAEAIAGSVAGTYWFLMLIGRFVGVALGAKISARAMLGWVSALGLTLVAAAMIAPSDVMTSMPVFRSATPFFGLAEVPVNALLLVLCGLCTSVMWGAIFNLAVEGLGRHTEKAAGYFMVLVCGGGILPLLQNGIVDMGLGYLASYWVVIAGMGYMFFYALCGSKIKSLKHG